VFVKTVVQHNFGKPQRTLLSQFQSRSGSPTAAGRSRKVGSNTAAIRYNKAIFNVLLQAGESHGEQRYVSLYGACDQSHRWGQGRRQKFIAGGPKFMGLGTSSLSRPLPSPELPSSLRSPPSAPLPSLRSRPP